MPELASDGQRVLIVDDDDALRRSLGRNLRLEGFRVADARDGGAALDDVRAHPPDAIVLDVTMPGIDGVELTRRLRAAGDDVPILILSARDGVDDRIVGLEAGADDYLVKPFIPRELVARLRALLRRRPEAAPRAVAVVGPLRIEPERQQAFIAGREVTLTKREFDLLAALATRPGVVFSRAELLSHVWGYPDDVHTNVVDVFVGYLRRKLEAGGEARVIQTVRGRGFTLRP
jgi:two-component system, OmpR family, response regulator PrrA